MLSTNHSRGPSGQEVTAECWLTGGLRLTGISGVHYSSVRWEIPSKDGEIEETEAFTGQIEVNLPPSHTSISFPSICSTIN